ncbi:MAG TPA: DNA mismatch repair endonuclease MutL, partial [Polyangiaceae bacterium]|nr:DNA mismatch repair endonuclease MutL [Polyangiaceae bacterium]
MAEEDALLCLQRHATSKLRSITDLEELSSYGFRGEALPSIASVSRLLLRTRRAESSAGLELSVDGGLSPSMRPVGCAPGTLVEVRDLFFNVPARRKFLRSASTESGHLTEIVEAVALARPTLAITLKRDGRLVRQWLRVGDRRERVLGMFEEELASCQGERGPLRVEAYLTRPERARTGAGGLRIFVNERPVRDRALAVAVAQAYGSVLERGRYPRGVVYLDLPARLVDFNVHPQKIELRFADPRAVSDALYQVLASQLARGFASPSGLAQRTDGGNLEPVPSEPHVSERPSESISYSPPPAAARSFESPRAAWAQARLADRSAPSGPALLPPPPSALPLPGLGLGQRAPTIEIDTSAAVLSTPPPAPALGEHVEWASLDFVAQVRNTFLICEGPSGLYLLDQHAAAERVTFDRLRRQYRERAVASQALLFPVQLELGADEVEFIERHATELAALGVDVRPRGSQWVSVHAVPRLLERLSPERLLRDLLAELLRQGGRGFSGAIDLALATLACH